MRVVLCLALLFACTLGLCTANPEIRINIPEYTLAVIDKGQVVKKYDIAVGTPYEQTPTGSFTIFLKQEHPTWYPGAGFADRTPVPPGADNPLGSRWMEFSPGYGIHGTNVDWSISYPVSGGCIRMHDSDARELYALAEIGTPVKIIYETIVLTEKSDGLYLKIMPDIYARSTTSPERLRQLFAPYAAGYRIIAYPAFPPADRDDTYEIKFAARQTSPPPAADIIPARPPKTGTASSR